MALLLAVPASALQVTFPLDETGGDTSAVRTAVLRSRSFKERFDKFTVGYSGDYYRYGTYGDRSRAFRPDETFFINNLSIALSERLDNGLDYDGKIITRYVTDRTVSNRKDLHITSFFSTLGRKDVWEVRGGDLFPSLSRYSFNRFAKGVQGHYFHDIGDSIRVKAVGIMSRLDRSREGRNPRRVALGAATTFESKDKIRGKRKWLLGYRYATVSDELSSIDNPASFADLQNTVHSIEYGRQLPKGWSIDGENAWSDGSPDRRTERDREGYAWRTDLAWLKQDPKPYEGWWRLAPFAFQGNWELVDPYFRSSAGVAASNQRRWGVRTAHRFNENVDWTLSFQRLEDNVRNQGNVTNMNRTTNAVMNLRPFKLFGASPNWTDRLDTSLRDLRARVEFRYNDRDASNGSVNAKTEDYIYQLLYNKWGTSFTGDYHFQITDDDRTPASERRLQAFGLRATRPFHYKKWNIRFFPSVGYRVSRDRFRIAGDLTDLQTTNFGLTVAWEELSGNFTYLILDSNRAPAGNDFIQRKFNSSITYKPYLFPTFQAVLSYGYLDQNEETITRSYRQTETRLTIGYSF